MIQDIAPYIFDNQYKSALPDRESYLLCFKEGEVLLKIKEGGIEFPRFGQLESQNEVLYEDCIYLFTIDKERFYLVNHITYSTDCGYHMENVEVFRRSQPQYLAFAGITAFQLYRWYQCRHFCGRCGKAMKHDEKERMVFCGNCGLQEYPKISPAVIVAVTDGDRILLSRYSGREYKNYALLAGFTEIGETIEETVKREVMEEVGLHVKNIKYYKSQPWSFSDTLLMGFYAELDGEKKITLDEEELEFAQWFERNDIPDTDASISLTNEMILRFKNSEN